MKLRSGNTTRYKNIKYIIDEFLYILNTIKKETILKERIYKTAELFDFLSLNKKFILINNNMIDIFKNKLEQLRFIDSYSEDNNCNKWKGTCYYYNNIFTN